MSLNVRKSPDVGGVTDQPTKDQTIRCPDCGWQLGAWAPDGHVILRRSKQIVAVLPVCPHAMLPCRKPGCGGAWRPASHSESRQDSAQWAENYTPVGRAAVRVSSCSLLSGEPAHSK
jgi:hypothetical protein